MSEIPDNIRIQIRKDLLHPNSYERYKAIRSASLWHDHEALHIAADDPDVDNRQAVARAGATSKDTLHKLINDNYYSVRLAVAQCGAREHHQILMHDKDPYVRAQVAYYADEDIREKLRNDPVPNVRRYANLNHEDGY